MQHSTDLNLVEIDSERALDREEEINKLLSMFGKCRTTRSRLFEIETKKEDGVVNTLLNNTSLSPPVKFQRKRRGASTICVQPPRQPFPDDHKLNSSATAPDNVYDYILLKLMESTSVGIDTITDSMNDTEDSMNN